MEICLWEFWVDSMEVLTDVTSLVEAFGLVESVLWGHKI